MNTLSSADDVLAALDTCKMTGDLNQALNVPLPSGIEAWPASGRRRRGPDFGQNAAALAGRVPTCVYRMSILSKASECSCRQPQYACWSLSFILEKSTLLRWVSLVQALYA
jgi:hypothetical protein